MNENIYQRAKRQPSPVVNIQSLLFLKLNIGRIAKYRLMTEPVPETAKPGEPHRVKFVDLFCGIGSFHYSFRKHGWSCVMACDINRSARETYSKNYGLTPLTDIVDISPESVPVYDVLCAGFPCQPFSQCGKHGGFNDERGTMFHQIMKFVKFHGPKIIVLENVQSLLTHDNGKTYKTMADELKKEHYIVCHKVLKCSDYGIPQMRKRLFVFAVGDRFVTADSLNKMLDFEHYRKTTTLSEYLSRNFEKNVAYTIRCGGRNSPITSRHNWDGYIVDGKEYRLSLEDCSKLQGFDEFALEGSDTEKWKLLGNTIPTIFTEMISDTINVFIRSVTVKGFNSPELVGPPDDRMYERGFKDLLTELEQIHISSEASGNAETPHPETCAGAEEDVDYAGKSVKELRELCRKSGIKGYSRRRKPELVGLLSKTTEG